MKTVVLVGCGKSKLDHPASAQELYTSSLFRKARAYAERHGDEWAILSAKHHVVLPKDVIEPYDLSLADFDPVERRQWQIHVNFKLRTQWAGWRYVALVGELYKIGFTWPSRLEVEYPMAGLGLGKRLQFLGNEGRKDA